MRNKLLVLLSILCITTSAWATTPRLLQFDEFQNLSGGSVIPMPSAGSLLMTDTNTVSASNKTFTAVTLSGGGSLSGTFTGTPTFSGALSLSGGPSISGAGSLSSAMNFVDSSDATKKLAFSLSGSTTGKTLTFTFSQTNTESVAFPNVGSGDSIATLNATQTFGAGSTWHGTVIGSAYGGASTTVNNSVASPQSVSAAGGISLTAPTFHNIVFVKGNTASSTITVTATPSITQCVNAGDTLDIVSESSTALLTLQNQGDLASSQLQLNGPWTSGMNNGTPYVLHLTCDNTASTPNWVEVGRNN